MKKILLSLATLMMTIGALAQSEIPTSKFNADELNSATETKRIAIRCTQESNYNTFYNGNGRANLPWTESMIYEWEAAEDGTHYIKKAYHDDGDENIYLLSNNTKTFGAKTANNVAKFTALPVSGDIANSGLNSDEDKTYWVRLALNPDKNTWFNFNGDTYNSGTGVWTVQHVMDMTGYYKIIINIVKDGATQTTTQIAKSGSTITMPEYEGYEADVKTVTKDATDTQAVTITYSNTVKTLTLTPGAYYIYYIDESNVKHYLQTTGVNNVTTVTENPAAYNVSTGFGSTFTHAYKLGMNGLYISNTKQNGTQIQAQATHGQDNAGWLSQVFLQKEENGGCAIRLTNAAENTTWHSHYFIGKPSTDGAVIGVDPATTAEADYYVWTIEKAPLNYVLNDNYGNQYTGSITDWSSFDAESVVQGISGTSRCPITDATMDGNTVTATITFPFAVSSESKNNPVMISSFSGNNFKWYADGTSIKAQKNAEATSTNVTNYLWAIYPSMADNALTFTIKNLATGTYIHSTSSTNTHNEGAVTLSDEASALTLESNDQLKLATGKYLSLNSSVPASPQIIGTWDTHNGTKNAFPAVSYNLTIGTTRAATLYTPIAVTIPTGAQARYVTTEGNGTAVTSGKLMYQVKEEGSTIPAESAVVVIGDAGIYTFTAANGEAGELTDNLLFGYGKDTSVNEHAGTGTTGSVYALTAVDGTAVFGHYVGTSYSAGKAYLDVTAIGAASVRYFSLFDDTETGIDNIQSNDESSNGAAYDLSGRRVQATAKGLYIINGKKVIK